jgi:predicted Zn-ribbon and HTH transcriptional regulator
MADVLQKVDALTAKMSTISEANQQTLQIADLIRQVQVLNEKLAVEQSKTKVEVLAPKRNRGGSQAEAGAPVHVCKNCQFERRFVIADGVPRQCPQCGSLEFGVE